MSTDRPTHYARGIALCLASAILFSLLGPFGKNAQSAGVSTSTLLTSRFLIAGVILVVVCLATGRRFPRGRALGLAVVLGGVGYSLQSLFYFGALDYLSVGVVSLLLYLFPVVVVVVSVLLRRTPATWMIALATVLAVGGVALTMLGGAQTTSLVGTLLGLGAALVYSAYYFGVEALPAATDRIAAAAIICLSAGVSQLLIGTARGTLRLDELRGGGLWWSIAVALVCTCVPIVLLLLGMPLTKAATASLVSCVEPVSAVLIGAAFYGDVFGVPQIVGTAAVIGAVILLELRGRRTASANEANEAD